MQDLLNIEKPIDFEGKTYHIRRPTLEDEGKLAVWLETQARDAVARDLTKTEDERRKADHQITLDAAAGVFDFTGELAAKALQSVRGSAKLVSIVAQMDPDTAERMFRAKANEIAELLGRAAHQGDPKAATELLRRLGFPDGFLSKSFATDSAPPPSKPSKNSRGSRSSRRSRK